MCATANGNCLVLCGAVVLHDDLFRRLTLTLIRGESNLNYLLYLEPYRPFWIRFTIKSLDLLLVYIGPQ